MPVTLIQPDRSGGGALGDVTRPATKIRCDQRCRCACAARPYVPARTIWGTAAQEDWPLGDEADADQLSTPYTQRSGTMIDRIVPRSLRNQQQEVCPTTLCAFQTRAWPTISRSETLIPRCGETHVARQRTPIPSQASKAIVSLWRQIGVGLVRYGRFCD